MLTCFGGTREGAHVRKGSKSFPPPQNIFMDMLVPRPWTSHCRSHGSPQRIQSLARDKHCLVSQGRGVRVCAGRAGAKEVDGFSLSLAPCTIGTVPLCLDLAPDTPIRCILGRSQPQHFDGRGL